MKMSSFVKKVFFLGLTILSSSITGALNCISLKNQKCKVRPKIVYVSSNKPLFYLFIVKINKCSDNCNSINDPYAKICVPDVVKNLNVKVFHLMSRTNETRSIKSHETYKCICRLNKIICNNKQKWNKDQCRCECKELIDKGVCDKRYILIQDCKCKEEIIDLFVEKCTEYDDNQTKIVNKTVTKNDNKAKLIIITVTKNDNQRKIVNKTLKNSCKVHIVLTIVSIVISTVYTIYFVYYNWFLIKNKDIFTKYNTRRETLIW